MAQAKRMAEFVYGDAAEIHCSRPLTCLIRPIVDVPGKSIVEVNIRLSRSSSLSDFRRKSFVFKDSPFQLKTVNTVI